MDVGLHRCLLFRPLQLVRARGRELYARMEHRIDELRIDTLSLLKTVTRRAALATAALLGVTERALLYQKQALQRSGVPRTCDGLDQVYQQGFVCGLPQDNATLQMQTCFERFLMMVILLAVASLEPAVEGALSASIL